MVRNQEQEAQVAIDNLDEELENGLVHLWSVLGKFMQEVRTGKVSADLYGGFANCIGDSLGLDDLGDQFPSLEKILLDVDARLKEYDKIFLSRTTVAFEPRMVELLGKLAEKVATVIPGGLA